MYRSERRATKEQRKSKSWNRRLKRSTYIQYHTKVFFYILPGIFLASHRNLGDTRLLCTLIRDLLGNFCCPA